MTISKIHEPIYDTTITFIFNEKREKVLNFLKDKTKKDFSKIFDDSGAFFVSNGEFEFYIVMVEDNDPLFERHLAHEGLHVTARVLRNRCIPLTINTEEAYTYYLAWIVGECTEIYRKHTKRKR